MDLIGLNKNVIFFNFSHVQKMINKLMNNNI